MSYAADRVFETTTSTGTGTIQLAGAATGYRRFVLAIGSGNPCYYVIENEANGQWEVGIGTVTAGTPDTLSRDTVLSSSDSGAKVDFEAGEKSVWISVPADRLVTTDTINELIDDRAAALIVNGTALSWTYNDGAGTLTGNVQLGTGATQAAAGNHDHSGVYSPVGHDHGSAYQPLDADLTALAGLSTTGGWAKRTALNTWELSTPTYTDVGAAASGHNHSGVYEPVISSGTTAQFWRGDKAWTTLNQATVAGLTTADSPQFAGVNIGHASDTTITRVKAGEIAVEGHTIYAAGTCTIPLSDGGTGSALYDPNADRILFWDDSAGGIAWLATGTTLSLSGTTLSANVGSLPGTVAAGDHEHLGVYQPAGTYYSPSGTDVALADGGTGASLTDPNADNMLFWDDSAGGVRWLVPGNSVAITNTQLDTIQDIQTSASPQFAGVNIGHASDTTLTRSSAGVLAVEGKNVYMAGGTDVALADGGTGASLADPNADRVLFWDDSAGAITWLSVGTGLSITDTTLASTITQYTDALAVTAIKADAAWHATNWDTAYGWGNHASAGYLTSQTSHADVVVDGDFASQGIMLRGASAGVYSILADNSANWNTAYGWGNHASAGYAAGGHNHSGTYEPAIASGTTAQYWRGDKAWTALNQAAVAGLTTADTPTFQGVTAAKTVAGSVTTTIQAQVTNSSSGETHTSKFACQDNNTGTIRALFACAGPLNSGDDNQGYFDLVVEDSTMYIGRWKSLAADGGTVMQLYDRASPQVIQITLHAAGTSFIKGGALVIGATSAADSALLYVDGKISTSGELEINGALNHDGTTAGVFGINPVSRASAYTQTYSTADKTHANSTYAAPSGGTTVDSQARTSLGQLAADVTDLKQLVNAIIDDLQAYGWFQ